VEHLLKSVAICLPLGSEDWQVVASLHSEKFPANKCDAAKLKHKFYEIVNKKPSTGNPELGVIEKSAKKIKEQINAKCGVSNDVNVDDDFEASDGEDLSPSLENNNLEMDASEGIIALSKTAEATAQAAMKTVESEKNDSGKKASEDMKKKDAAKDAAATLANSSRKNKTKNLISVLQTSNGDMMRVMQMMMMQRQITMEDDAAERRADRERHERAMEAERLRHEQEQLEYRRQRDEAAEETRRQERRQDKKMNQLMQMAFTAFMMYNCKSTGKTNPFQNFSDSDDDSDKKRIGRKAK
jgi:hypothetical protein